MEPVFAFGFSVLALAVSAASDAPRTPPLLRVLEALGGPYAVNALAQAAVLCAVPVVKPVRPHTQATADWVKANFTRIFPLLVKHVNNNMRRSRDLGLSEDHVQTFLERLVRNDTFGPYLEAGKPVKDGVLMFWVLQSACTEVRADGTDPVCRTTRGSRTHRERQQPNLAPTQAPEPIQAVYGTDGADGSPTQDLVDPMVSAEEALARRHALARCRNLIRKELRAQEGGRRHLAVFDALAEGVPVKALGADYGLKRDQVAAVLGDLRRVLGDAGVALRVN